MKENIEDKSIVVLNNITKNYYLKDKKINVLKNLSANFKTGKFYAIMGHSGCGKSTLINIIGLLDTIDSGEYFINKIKVENLNDKFESNLRKKYIGFIFQDFYLDEHLKAIENVMLPMMLNKELKIQEKKELAYKLLDKFEIAERAEHFPKELSGGERQRIAIARALANDPKIILADEPTGDLDELNEKKIFEILKDLSIKGKCVIVVSHSNEVKKYADKVFLLKNGILSEVNDESY